MCRKKTGPKYVGSRVRQLNVEIFIQGPLDHCKLHRDVANLCLAEFLVLPRTFLQSAEKKFPSDRERLGRMSLIEEGYPK